MSEDNKDNKNSLQDFLNVLKDSDPSSGGLHKKPALPPDHIFYTGERAKAAQKLQTTEPSKEDAPLILHALISDLITLSDAGDRGAQGFLLDFAAGAEYLIGTALDKPGEPCPNCKKNH